MKIILKTFIICTFFSCTTYAVSAEMCPALQDLKDINRVLRQSPLDDATSLALLSNNISTINEGFTYHWEIYGVISNNTQSISSSDINSIGHASIMTEKAPYKIQGAYTCYYNTKNSTVFKEFLAVNTSITGKYSQTNTPPGLALYSPFYWPF